jgi:predicted phosphodiesterase
MRLAILSDIHANLPALEAVLADVGERSPEALWCLGDVVGYGAEPNECTALVAERCDVAIAGNHDLGVLGSIDIASFSPAAAEAAEWTRSKLSGEARAYLEALEPAREDGDPAIYHASPRDHVWEYVLWPEQAGECLREQASRVSLIGHSHVALCFHESEDGDPDGTRGAQVPGGTTLEAGEGRWLLNPGSVGQPRDGDPRAAWVELDTETWRATYHRVAYDIEKAADSIIGAGLPEHLGRRLFLGQ